MDTVIPQQTPFLSQNRSATGPIDIVKVDSRRKRDTFILLPRSLYKNDPVWVPPLLLERRMHLSPKNPYFEHADSCLWVAYRNGKPVGRISAQVDRLHLEQHRDDTGFWGMIEAEDNLETFRALLETAENWLKDKGVRRARGPFNLSINQECGLLVEGYDTPPAVMMGHALPYYHRLIKECGYQKEKDLLAYTISAGFEPSPAMQTIIKRTEKHIRVRKLRKKFFKEELSTIQTIFNDAWSKNWGFIPFTEKEFKHLGDDLKLLVNEDFIGIAEVDGEPAAFMVVLPNLNEAIKACNGRLLPFGWLKLLWRMKIIHPTTARIPLMGIRREYQNSLLGAGLAYRLIGDLQNPVVRYGIKNVELSWILEDNTGMRKIIENISGNPYKTYRIYDKQL